MGQRQGELERDSTGQFFRQLGRKAGLAGQPKFRLGRDAAKARLAYEKLGILWEIICDEMEASASRQLDYHVAKKRKPEWNDVTLAIANAVRLHQPSVRIAVPENIRDPSAYVAYIDHLRQRFNHIIYILPEDVDAAEAGKADHRHFAEHRAKQARLNARIAGIPVPDGLAGLSLHEALERYAVRASKENTKESGIVQAANARRLKASIHDMDLSEFGYSAMEQIKCYWTSRPIAKLRGGKSTGRPIGLSTVKNHLDTARRFVRWLDRTDAIEWEMPRHGLDALTANLHRLETDEETAGRQDGVRVFTIDQLAVIYRHATDFERLLLLLGLNAGMAQAEINTLRWDEIKGEPASIKRLRRKSKVYGEFELWPETQAALDWWRKIRPPTGPLVATTATGKPIMRTEITNAWVRARKRIDHAAGSPIDWWLPFKHLRKTGAQLVRNVSDGEVAGVFLSHGKPVATDQLSERYSNRPFPKVAEALRLIRTQLRPGFEAVPDAFLTTRLGRGSARAVPRLPKQ